MEKQITITLTGSAALRMQLAEDFYKTTADRLGALVLEQFLKDSQQFPTLTAWEHDGVVQYPPSLLLPRPTEESPLLTYEMFLAAFTSSGRAGLPRGELVKIMVHMHKVAESVVWRALKGYAQRWLDEVAGIVALKK